MSASEKLNELKQHRHAIETDGEKELIVRQRIKAILDNNSFVELGAFATHRCTDFNLAQKEVPADGVVTGYGTIEGRLVYIYSQDAQALGGSIGEINAKKIGKVYEQALKMGAIVIAILDSKGIRIQEGLDSFEGYGQIIKYQSIASGVVPQISVVLGDSLGINSIIPALSDFVFMEQKKSRIFVNSPNTAEDIKSYEEAEVKEFGNSKTHSEKTGLAHFCYETEEECLNAVRTLVSFLPSNNLEDAPLHGTADDLNRKDEFLNDILDDDNFDITKLILSISDSSCFLEVKKDFAKNIITGFVRINGYTAAIVANQTLYDEGRLDKKGCDKAVEFINFCDSFNIPIITLTNTSGYKTTLSEELNGLSKSIAKLAYSFANATVAKINIIVKQAFGSSYMIMNSKHIGADIVYAWPSSEIALMEAEAAVKIMYSDELKSADVNIDEKIQQYRQMQSSYTAAKRGYIDDIIEPAETRKYIISALEMLESKREGRPSKKHSSISL